MDGYQLASLRKKGPGAGGGTRSTEKCGLECLTEVLGKRKVCDKKHIKGKSALAAVF